MIAYAKPNLQSDGPHVVGFSGSLVVDTEGYFHGVFCASTANTKEIQKELAKIQVEEDEGPHSHLRIRMLVGEKECDYLTEDGYHKGGYFSKVPSEFLSL